MNDELASLIQAQSTRDADTKTRPITIMGAGSVGTQLAQTVAANGLEVILIEINPKLLDSVKRVLKQNMDQEIRRWGLTVGEKRSILSRITITTQIEDAAKSRIILEAIPESLSAKQEVFRRLDGICPPDSIFITNTSILSLTEIASALPVERQRKMIGLHFLRPVPRIPLVEIVRGLRTDDSTFAEVQELAAVLGKTAVEVFEYPGYVTTRIILPLLNEAMHVLMEGVASAEDIDTAMKLGFDFPMGPLAMADQFGLDDVMDRLQALFFELGDLKYRPCPILKKMVRAGRLGVKSGRGFFEYPALEEDEA